MQKIFVLVILALILGGCATGARKQQQAPQPVTYEKPQRSYQQETYYPSDYDYEDDTRPSESYKKPVSKTYSEPAVELSHRQIQKALKNAGYYQGAIDGKIGPKTKEAILKFQRAKGLKADGVVGKKTSAALNRYLD
ncbi:MAG: Zinc D-Ala-D-Ala carboxypeptidase precursor [Smithella sp. PtaU1.Bin162]|nr:MAG: Zinc D-Ala-D-Ala carboxypeptidase precursor [Smithella sp. PtaU1.Bin162]